MRVHRNFCMCVSRRVCDNVRVCVRMRGLGVGYRVRRGVRVLLAVLVLDVLVHVDVLGRHRRAACTSLCPLLA